MTYIVGMDPGTQYTGDDFLKGKIPALGTRGMDAQGREFVMCLVGAAQNVINGHLVAIDGVTFTVTVPAGGPAAPGPANILGVARTTVTASASAYIWVQRYGIGSVQASASALPNAQLAMSAATAGFVDDTLATASALIEGLMLTATAAASGITACFLSYPRFCVS